MDGIDKFIKEVLASKPQTRHVTSGNSTLHVQQSHAGDSLSMADAWRRLSVAAPEETFKDVENVCNYTMSMVTAFNWLLAVAEKYPKEFRAVFPTVEAWNFFRSSCKDINAMESRIKLFSFEVHDIQVDVAGENYGCDACCGTTPRADSLLNGDKDAS